MKKALAFLIAALPAFAAGTVQQSTSQIGSSNIYVVSVNFTGDPGSGSVPATALNLPFIVQGYRVATVEFNPGSPTPTNGMNITLVSSGGVDLLGGLAIGVSTAAASSFNGAPTSAPVYGSPTLTITGQNVAGAKGALLIYLAPLTNVFGLSPTSPSFPSQGANLFYSSPNGASGSPGFRAIVPADVPPTVLNSTAQGGVTGTLPIANGGTASGTAATARTTLAAAGLTDNNALSGNETHSGSETFTGLVDSSGATHTLPAKTGILASRPATCTVGEVYFASDGTAGQNFYYCTATNTWTIQKAGSTISLSPSDFVWSQTPAGSIVAGVNTVTLTPCPFGLNATDQNHAVYLSGPSAATVLTITGATNAAPIVIQTSAAHGLVTGNFVLVAGVGGNVSANGPWIVTFVDGTHFSLNNSAGSNGASYTSGGTASFGPEADFITGGTCTSGAATGTINLTAANAHSAGYTIGTATSGGQEAIQQAFTLGINSVQFPGGAFTQRAGMFLNAAPSNFGVSGTGRGTVLTMSPAMPNVYMVSAVGTTGQQTSVTVNLPENARSTSVQTTINVSSNTGFSVGDYVQLAYPGKGYTINGATNATPIVVSFTGTHQLVNGDYLGVSSVAGNTGANGGWFVTVVDPTHVSLNNSVGNGAYTSGGGANTNSFSQVLILASSTGTTLTFQAPVMIPLRSTDANNVTKINMVHGVSITDMTFDGAGIGDGTFDTSTNQLFGVSLTNVADSVIRGLLFRNFTMSAGIHTGAGYGHNNRFSDLSAINSGSSGYNDISIYNQTHCQASNLNSTDAYGFAIGFFLDVDCQATNITSESPRARGLKISGSGWNQFTNIATNRSKTGNGTAFAGGSYRNILRNVTSTLNPTNEGIWFAGQNDEYNLIDGANLFCNGIHDLFFNQSDTNNTAKNILGGSVCTGDLGDNGGTPTSTSGNTLSTAVPLRALAFNSISQSIPNNAFTSLTFDTNFGVAGAPIWDYSGTAGVPVHSTSSNTSRFTVPAGQAGAGSFTFGGFLACGQVTFAASAVGRRQLVIAKNGTGIASTGGAITVTANPVSLSLCTVLPLSSTDFVEFQAFQDSGGALNASGTLVNSFGSLVKIF